MGRRTPFVSVRQEGQGPKRRVAYQMPRGRVLATIFRLFLWGLAATRLGFRIVWDTIAGRRETSDRARRLRQMFEEMGGTAVKLGQQLSIRSDILPPEVCDELASLLDSVPPFPSHQAIAEIEKVSGKPLAATFAAFDPEPIGSASIACVYQAQLLDGTKVAVKVRRPDAAAQFSADLRAFGWFTKTLEALTLVKPSFFRHMRTELHSMFAEELNFQREARYQRLFRKLTKKAKLKFVTAPKVYDHIAAPSVMISEFMPGVWLSEVLFAAESGDEDALGRLAEMGIHPKKVAQDLLHTLMWQVYESLFFHADPHPANIILQEGGKLVLIDFGACGATSRAMRLNQRFMVESFLAGDVTSAAEAATRTLMPLPRINVHELKKKIEASMGSYLLAARDDDSEWWERTSAAVWIELISVSREFGLSVNLDTLRLARSTLLYDTLVYRLYREVDWLKEYRRYAKRRSRRRAKRSRRRIEKVSPGLRRDMMVEQYEEGMEQARHGLWRAQQLADDIPYQFDSAIGKGAFAAQVLIRFALWTFVLVPATAAMIFGYLWLRHDEVTQLHGSELIRTLVAQPAVAAVVGVFLFISLRRILFRLVDVDEQVR